MADDAKIVEIAKAVVGRIVESGIEGLHAVQRRWLLEVDRRDLEAEPTVIVHAGNSTEDLSAFSRGEVAVDHMIEIGIQAILKSEEAEEREAEVDVLAKKAEEIRDLFHEPKPKLPVDGINWKRSDHDPVTDEEYLQTEGIFFSLIKVVYTENRPRRNN